MQLLKPLAFPDGSVQVTAAATLEFTSILIPPLLNSQSVESIGSAFQIKAGFVRFSNAVRANKCGFEVAKSGLAGCTVQFAIYDSNRNLVIQSGALDAATGGSKRWVFPERVFPAGDYYFAWTFSDTTAQMRCANLQQPGMFQEEGPRTQGIVGGTASATAMPASIGNFTSPAYVGAYPVVQLYKI